MIFTGRKQFTFYGSFYDAIRRIKKDADRAKAYDAICAYALLGVDPDLDKLPDSAAIAFINARPNLDASRRKADGGKRGGSSKHTESIAEASGKQTARIPEARETGKREETASEKENEIENEIEIENECYPPTPLLLPEKANAVSAVLADYLDRINPSASPGSLDELRGYAEELGEAVCRRAFDIALDNKKATWPYIKAILRDKQARGVRCLADWDALEAQRKDAGQSPRKSFAEVAAEMDAEEGK